MYVYVNQKTSSFYARFGATKKTSMNINTKSVTQGSTTEINGTICPMNIKIGLCSNGQKKSRCLRNNWLLLLKLPQRGD